MNAHLAYLRIVFGAAVALGIFLIVHTALQTFVTTANLLAGR